MIMIVVIAILFLSLDFFSYLGWEGVSNAIVPALEYKNTEVLSIH